VIEKDECRRIYVFVIAAKNDLIMNKLNYLNRGIRVGGFGITSVAFRRKINNGVKTVEELLVLDTVRKILGYFI
jgi:hypothetical protein